MGRAQERKKFNNYEENSKLLTGGKRMKQELLLASAEVVEQARKAAGKKGRNFTVDKNVILLFSNVLLEYLTRKAQLKKYSWLEDFHPYASGAIYRGRYKGTPLTVMQPPMGASPMAVVVEDLITCGAKAIFLICGAWGIGAKVKLNDFIIPTHTGGPDGTTIHYGRASEEELPLTAEIVRRFKEETAKRTENYHLGKNYAKEAFYRITRKEIIKLQEKGFIAMENGELNVLGTICRQKKVQFGALFYSYYNPLEGWTIPWLKTKEYKTTVELEGEITLAVLERLEAAKGKATKKW